LFEETEPGNLRLNVVRVGVAVGQSERPLDSAEDVLLV
jgi:hypothetical protein